MVPTAESTVQTSVTRFFFRCTAHGRGVPCAATRRPSRLPGVLPACMGAGASPAPLPAALGLQNRAHWPLPQASSARPRPSRRWSIGARSSPPTPPLTVLLAARSMAVTIGRICLLLGGQDALLMAETQRTHRRGLSTMLHFGGSTTDRRRWRSCDLRGIHVFHLKARCLLLRLRCLLALDQHRGRRVIRAAASTEITAGVQAKRGLHHPFGQLGCHRGRQGCGASSRCNSCEKSLAGGGRAQLSSESSAFAIKTLYICPSKTP